jgi:hypothetical protein
VVPSTINDRHVSSSSYDMHVPLLVVPSTINEKLIIASNLADRDLMSFISFFYSNNF